MQIETLLIISRNEQVLLGYKNPEKKFGGNWNGWGGKVEENENIEDALIREIAEESTIEVISPREVGRIKFIFPTEEPDHYVHIYTSREYIGELGATNDFIKYEWFDVNNLPEEMMPADKRWIPLLAENKLFQGEIYFDEKMVNPQVNLREVEKLK